MVIKRTRYLKGKKILITAGPTWVPIDSVRVISNVATGETGILLAEKLQRLGAKVTLLLGPVQACCLNKKIRLIHFRFFAELRNILVSELRSKKYDVIIHSAAVSDFKPRQAIKGKITSGKAYILRLSPLPKIIQDIRRLGLKAKLVMFKLEAGLSDNTLIKRGRQSLAVYRADLVIANRTYPQYRAFILDQRTIYGRLNSKKNLVKGLTALLRKNFNY